MSATFTKKYKNIFFFVFDTRINSLIREDADYDEKVCKGIVFFYPQNTTRANQIDEVLRCISLVDFLQAFGSNSGSCHTDKTLQYFLKPKPDFCIGMTVNLSARPIFETYDTQFPVFDSIFTHLRNVFCFFVGFLESDYSKKDLSDAKCMLYKFFETIPLEDADLVEAFFRNTFVPSVPKSYEKMRCLLSKAQQELPHFIVDSVSIVFKDEAVSTGLCQEDEKLVYCLTTRLFSTFEILGSVSKHFRVLLNRSNDDPQECLLVVFKNFGMTMCCFIQTEQEPDEPFISSLHKAMKPLWVHAAGQFLLQESPTTFAGKDALKYHHFLIEISTQRRYSAGEFFNSTEPHQSLAIRTNNDDVADTNDGDRQSVSSVQPGLPYCQDDAVSCSANLASSILKENDPTIEKKDDGSDSLALDNQRKHFFILNPNKGATPIYMYGKPFHYKMHEKASLLYFLYSRPDDERREDDHYHLKTILAFDTKIVFLSKLPLILVVVSELKDSIQKLELQLEYLYNQLYSLVYKIRLEPLDEFLKRASNYPLEDVLHEGGNKRFLDNLINYMDKEPSVLLRAVRCLRMSAIDRDSIQKTIRNQCILSKIKNLQFIFLIGNNQLISLVSFNKNLLHPSDVHLVINQINSSAEMLQEITITTLICLPNLDSRKLFQVCAAYLSVDCSACLVVLTTGELESENQSLSPGEHSPNLLTLFLDAKEKIFEQLKSLKSKATHSRHENLLKLIEKNLNDSSALNGMNGSVIQIRNLDVQHFLYKSLSLSEYTCGSPSPLNQNENGWRTFMANYWFIHGRMHSPTRPMKKGLKVVHRKEILDVGLGGETLFGRVTKDYELCMILKPMMARETVLQAANSVTGFFENIQEREAYFSTKCNFVTTL